MGLKIQNVWNHHLDLILMSSDILSTSLYLHCSPCKATTSQQDKHWSWSFTQMGKIVFYNRTLHAISMWFSSCDFFADINVRISQQTLHYTHLWKEAVAWCCMTISIWYRPTNSSRPSPIPNCPPPFCPGQIDPGAGSWRWCQLCNLGILPVAIFPYLHPYHPSILVHGGLNTI